MRGDNPITDADVRSAMNDMEHHGALVKQLFKERDELRAKLAAAEAEIASKHERYAKEIWDVWSDKRDAAVALAARLATALRQRQVFEHSLACARSRPRDAKCICGYGQATAALADWEAYRP